MSQRSYTGEEEEPQFGFAPGSIPATLGGSLQEGGCMFLAWKSGWVSSLHPHSSQNQSPPEFWKCLGASTTSLHWGSLPNTDQEGAPPPLLQAGGQEKKPQVPPLLPSPQPCHLWLHLGSGLARTGMCPAAALLWGLCLEGGMEGWGDRGMEGGGSPPPKLGHRRGLPLASHLPTLLPKKGVEHPAGGGRVSRLTWAVAAVCQLGVWPFG